MRCIFLTCFTVTHDSISVRSISLLPEEQEEEKKEIKTHKVAANDIIFTKPLSIVLKFTVRGFLASSTIAIGEGFLS